MTVDTEEPSKEYVVLDIVLSRGIRQAFVRCRNAEPGTRPRLAPLSSLHLAAGAIDDGRALVTRAVTTLLQTPSIGAGSIGFGTSTKFKAFQFRPLLRFFGPAGRRLLIADEAGLGKTIEAGYILTECIARGLADRVVIVAPPRLLGKWRLEMGHRFGLFFPVYASARSLYMSLRNPSARVWGIVSQDAGRNFDLRRFRELLPTSPIDLLIVDEIHNMIGRGGQTLRREFVAALSLLSAGMVGLSATPVHLELEDLRRVLDLTTPGLFPQKEFDAEVNLAGLVNRAGRLLLRDSLDLPTQAEVARIIRDIDAILPKVSTASRERAAEFSRGLGDEKELEEVSSRRHLARLSSYSTALGRHFSRTRAADVREDRPRDVVTVRVDLATTVQSSYQEGMQVFTSEADLYERVDGLLKRSFFPAHRSQLASCLPAMVDLLRRGETGADSWEALPAEEESTFEKAEVPARLNQIDREESGRLANLFGLLERDSKWARLVETLREQEDRGARKVLLFTHWIPTYRYLSQRLQSHGEIPWVGVPPGSGEEAVNARVRRFIKREGFAVLLVTDLLREGVDLDAADCVVNYDIPYNPQIVEQRIGRVDRVTQLSDRISIVNLITRGSLDEKVYETVLSRIGVFERSIGEMRPIAPEMIRDIDESAKIELQVERMRTEQMIREELINREAFYGVEDALDESIRAAHREQATWPLALRWLPVSQMLLALRKGIRATWEHEPQALFVQGFSEGDVQALQLLAAKSSAEAVAQVFGSSEEQAGIYRLPLGDAPGSIPALHPFCRLSIEVAAQSLRMRDGTESPIRVRLALPFPEELRWSELVVLVRHRFAGKAGDFETARVYALSTSHETVHLSGETACEVLLLGCEGGVREPPMAGLSRFETRYVGAIQRAHEEWCKSRTRYDSQAEGWISEVETALSRVREASLKDLGEAFSSREQRTPHSQTGQASIDEMVPLLWIYPPRRS